MTQMIIAGAIGLLVSIFITPWLIRKFSAVGIGQEIREEGPKSHLRKRGTPTMGGIAILIGITVAYVTVDVYGEIANVGGFTVSGLLVLGLTLSLGGLGFADDYIKLVKHRNLGLNKKAKLIGQFVIALAFGIMIRLFPNEGAHPRIHPPELPAGFRHRGPGVRRRNLRHGVFLALHVPAHLCVE